MLVASLLSGFSLNFGEIIANEIKIWAIRTDTSYPFPYLITGLFEEAHVPFISGLDYKEKEIKTHNFHSRDDNQPTLSLGKEAIFGDDTLTVERTQTHAPISRSA